MLPKASEGRRRRRKPRCEVAEMTHPTSLRRRREGAAAAAAAGRRISRLVYLSGAFLGAAAAMVGVEGQYTDGGQVSVDCDRCACEGTSGDDSVIVFDNPSSGARIAGIDGAYSEIAETSCGTSAFAVGDTIYELAGVDLESRELEAVEMSATDDCTVSTAPSTADCYSGNTAMSLDGGVSMTMTVCLCIYMEGLNTFYRSKVSATVQGASAVSIPSDEMQICLDGGFISQLVTATVEGETYIYNFDLAVPGEDTSADLSVAAAPGSAAQSFICGELDPTPAPVTPTPPTPEPTAPPPDPTPAPVTPIPPTPEPTEPPPDPTPAPVTPLPPPTPAPVTPLPPLTPAPVTPATPAPVTPATPAPTVPPPEPTDPPVPPPTPGPVLPSTPDPVPPPTPGPVPASTPPPTAPPVTAAPSAAAVVVPETTPGPTASVGTATPRALPTASPTGRVVATETPVLPSAGGATSAPSEGRGGITSAPSAAGSVAATLAPLLSGVVTAAPTPGVAGNESASPTGFGGGGATSWPTAVGGVSGGGANTPAPSVARTASSTAMPSTNNPISDASARDGNLAFEDKPLTIGGDGRGVDAEVVALALLALLTFFPVCVK